MSTPSTFSLAGKTAVVTGGASGIGLAICETFAEHGATIRILDINPESAAAAAKKIIDAGGAATGHACDLTDEAFTNRVFAEVNSLSRVDVLVNNVGIAHVGTVESTTAADFDRLYDVNVKGYFHATKAAIGPMREAGGGVILNMASISGMLGLADRFAYGTTKGAVIAMTYSIARDYLQHNIRCNCISPARVHTPFVDGFLRHNYRGHEDEMFIALSKTQPVGRMGKPHEVAALALYLCSDASSFVTGCNYPLDGGYVNLRG